MKPIQSTPQFGDRKRAQVPAGKRTPTSVYNAGTSKPVGQAPSQQPLGGKGHMKRG